MTATIPTARTEMTLPGLHADLFDRLPRLKESLRVLDLGCGTGAWLERLHGAGVRNCHGVDFAPPDSTGDGPRFHKCDLARDCLPFASACFDYAFAIEVIEHIENPGHLLSEVSRVLVPGGRLLLTTPNVESLLSRLRFLACGKLRQFDEKADPTHIIPVLRESLRKIARRHGLDIESGWHYPPEPMGRTSRPILRAAARMLATVLPDSAPGDIACYVLVKR